MPISTDMKKMLKEKEIARFIPLNNQVWKPLCPFLVQRVGHHVVVCEGVWGPALRSLGFLTTDDLGNAAYQLEQPVFSFATHH